MAPLLFNVTLVSTGLAVGLGAGYMVSQSTSRKAAPPVSVPVPSGSKSILDDKLRFADAEKSQIANLPLSNSDVLNRKAYTAGYDRRLQHPSWTAEHLTAATMTPSRPSVTPLQPGDQQKVSREKSRFEEDEQIPALWRAQLKDYFRSGYDRGHMVPAADAKISQEAMDETFLLSNIAPQVGDGFNRHYWAYLENWCRKLTGQFTDVYVFTIPLYLPSKSSIDGKWRVSYEVIGSPPSISVPTHFSKVILASRPPKGESPLSTRREISIGAFVLPNSVIPDEASLESFIVPVEAVEKASGLSLFAQPLKQMSLPLCSQTKCAVEVRRFDNAQKKLTDVGNKGDNRR